MVAFFAGIVFSAIVIADMMTRWKDPWGGDEDVMP